MGRLDDLEQFRFRETGAGSARPAGVKPPRHKAGEHFLKGPIPWSWLRVAAQAPGRVLHVGVCLWFRSGITRHGTVTLSRELLSTFGVDRYAYYRALRALEREKLVTVERRRGRAPLVALQEAPR